MSCVSTWDDREYPPGAIHPPAVTSAAFAKAPLRTVPFRDARASLGPPRLHSPNVESDRDHAPIPATRGILWIPRDDTPLVSLDCRGTTPAYATALMLAITV